MLDGLLLLAWSRLLVRRLTTSGSAGRVRGSGSSSLGIAALWIAFFAAMQVGNLYGFDGTSVWQTLTTPGAAQFDVRGRQWAWTLIVAPVALLAALARPRVADSPGAYPWVLALLPALLGGGAGTVVLISVLAPAPMPNQRRGNPFTASGQVGGFGLAMTRIGLSPLQLAAALPPLVLLVLGVAADLPVATWLAVPVGVASGVTTAWWWGRSAHRRLAERGPELLAALR